MIDPAPVLIIDLSAGYTPAGRARRIAMVVNAQGFTLAYSKHHPASNLRDALCPGTHVVSIGAAPAEIRERTEMADASGRMIGAMTCDLRDALAAVLAHAELTTERRLAALEN